MAMPLCGLYHMPHGQAVGMTLPVVLRYNAQVAEGKIRTVLKVMNLMGISDDQDLESGLARLQAFLSDSASTLNCSPMVFRKAIWRRLKRDHEQRPAANQPPGPLV